jgi:4-diphosphocytidyl-2-C-methyl-D-erythritol kinase
MGLNNLLGLKVSEEKLSGMASRLGSDVPFFLGGPLALCSGRGEKIEKIERIFRFSAILVVPDVSVCTKEVYDNFKQEPAVYEDLNSRINQHIEKNRIDLVAHLCANMMLGSCFQLYKELAKLKTKIEDTGAGPVCLSGSGSALYVLFEGAEEQKAKMWQGKLTKSVDCESVIVNSNRW